MCAIKISLLDRIGLSIRCVLWNISLCIKFVKFIQIQTITILLQISGTIANTGHSVIFTADNETSSIYEGPQTPVNLTGGPLSYRYRFQEIHIHYGLHDQFGSEHSVQGYTFPAEVNILNNMMFALIMEYGVIY